MTINSMQTLDDFIKDVREFVNEEVNPFSRQYEIEECIPRSLFKKMATKGYLGSMISKRYGGTEMDRVRIGYLNEEFAKGSTSVRSILTVQGMVAIAIEKWASKVHRENILPKLASGELIGAFGLSEPNVGSDAKSVETTAVFEDDTVILNGTKKWITMGQIADIFIIFANHEGKVTTFLVNRETEGLSVKPISGLLGVRASMLAEIKLENCRIPKDNIIGSIGTGLSHVGLSCLDYGRYTVAWGAVGLAQVCLDSCLKYGSERKQFNKPIIKHQLVQKMITEMVVGIKSARLLCLNAGKLREEGDPDYLVETWCAKYMSSKVVNDVAAKAVQIFGAEGYTNENDIERYFRDAKMAEIIEGTSQIHELIISSNVNAYSK